MDPSSDGMLARIWADAPPLSRFIEERAEQLCLKAAPTAGRKIRRVPRKLSTMEGITVLMEAHGNMNLARGKAHKTTINDLTAGRLVALGRQTDSYFIEIVNGSFWIGAEVQGDTASRDGVKLIEVRLVPPDALPVAHPKGQPEPKISTTADVIRAAIAEYAKGDTGLRHLPSKRYRAYKTYITSKKFDPNQRGFSDKTFEKYELEFKHKIK